MKKLTLDAPSIVKYDENNTLVVSSSRDVQIETKSKYNLERAFYSFKNADVTVTVPYCRIITVPEKVIFAGNLDLVVRLYDERGQVLKKWQVYPLKIIEVNGGFELSDWCENIEAEIEKLKKNLLIIM